MQKQITTWLLLLFLWSGWGIESATGQTISQFPYELTPSTYNLWTLGDSFEWLQNSAEEPGYGFKGESSYEYTESPTFDFSTLKDPVMTFTGWQVELYGYDKDGKTIATYSTNTGIINPPANQEIDVTFRINKNIVKFYCSLKDRRLNGTPFLKNFKISEKEVISQFPYTLTPHAEGWTRPAYGEWEWSDTYPIIQGTYYLQSPDINFPAGGGELTIKGYIDTILVVDKESNIILKKSYKTHTETELTYVIPLPKETHFINISSRTEYRINELTMRGFENSLEWEVNDNTYILKGTDGDAGQTTYCKLPQITGGNKTIVSFNIASSSLENVDLYFVEGTTETPITTTNGKVEIALTTAYFNGIPSFKVVSKGGKIPEITISNFTVRTLEHNPNMQFDLSYWYDENRDGQMEFYLGRESYNIKNYHEYGKYKIENNTTPVKYEELPNGISILRPYNINNDKAIDYCAGILKEDSNDFNYKLYINNEKGESKVSQEFGESNGSNTIFIPCDYNNDGLTDFLLADGKVAVQLPNGLFQINQLEIITQEEYLNRDKTNDEWKPSRNGSSSIVVQNRNDAFLSMKDMFIGENSNYIGNMGYQTSNIDFNKDGYPDIVNTSTGEILLYAAKDKYITLPMGGAILFRDLNNDQQPDYIVYEPTTKTVTAHVYQSDGTETVQELMSNLSMDQQVWCYDFDKDGDVDILLPFSYLESNGASFLVVMENDGTGKFKMHDTTFDEKLQFVACADIDGDGYYDIVAKYAENSTFEYNDILLLKGNGKMQFQLQSEPLLRLEKAVNSGYYNFQVADINNDGYYEIMAQYTTPNASNTSITVSGIYAIKDLLSNVVANKTPQKPVKPSYIFESATGFLKISWQQGKDAESSGTDLTYALRIGTEPGKGDIYYAHAMENGTRLNLLDGNMGYDLDRILDASGWNAGKYYIAVQTIDPMHRGSAWSEESIFEKKQLNSSFRIFEGRTTEDTITLALTAPKAPAIEYKWDMADATIISQNNDGSIYQIKFPTPGKKRIFLQASNAQGEALSTTDEDIFIFANKITSERCSYSPELAHDINAVIDMDNDGVPELLTENGVYENKGNGNYSKIKKIYNTNLSFRSSYFSGLYIADINKDGLADALFASYDGSNYFINHYINEGEKVFSLEKHAGNGFNNDPQTDKETIFADFNNDGYMDYQKNGKYKININSGDDLNFHNPQMVNVDNDSDYPAILIADLNKNGYYDGIHHKLYPRYGFAAIFYMNNGDDTFSINRIPVTETSFIPENAYEVLISAVADMNNDGYTDLIIKKNDQTILILLNNKNESFNEIIEVNLPRKANDFTIGKIFDYDNNGLLDIAINSWYENKSFIIYFYDSWKIQSMSFQDKEGELNSWCLNMDIDNNGTPDFNRYSFYSYYKNSTTITNTRPEAPTNVRGAQTGNFVTLQWDAAKDAETPYAQMRYNISVKKQGAIGKGAFIISPMNDLKADAAIIPNYTYPSATKYSIPTSVIPAGTYEVQVQAIDGWNATSPFSEVYILKVEANPQMQMPTAVCAGSSATVTYSGNASASGLTWNWDGGQLLYQDRNNYEVVWNTEGKKQISVTSDGVTSTAEIWVAPAIDPNFSINNRALLYAETPLTLPEGNYYYLWEISKDGSEFKVLQDYKIAPVKFIRNGNSNEAKATFMGIGNYILRLNVYTPCGMATCDRSVTVTDVLDKLQIELVTIDPATGKYNITWQYSSELPEFVTNVKIYKEGSKYNDFQLLATVPVSQMFYIDMTSNPQISASRYCLALETNYGAETTLGTPHQGVHAMLNKGAGSGWNVIWSRYEGATIETYRILRGTTTDNMTVIGEISGNATSYSDLNAPAGTLYYALDFDAAYENNWSPMKAATQSRAGQGVIRSNVVSTDGAASVIFAEDIIVRSIEEPALSPKQTNIQLTADIYPLTASFRTVNWTITDGSNLATIDKNGILTAKGDKNGSVIVRASAIDGSNIYSEITIPVSNMTSVNEYEEDKKSIIIYPVPVTDYLCIKNLPESNGRKTKIYIFNPNGQPLYMEETTAQEVNIPCSSHPTGIYILKVVTTNSVMTQQYLKK